jgi:hypothetical protein
MQGPGEEKEHKQNAVVEGEYAKGSASVEDFEEVGAGACVQQDPGDQKTGEDEEEIDAEVAGLAELVEEI